MARMEAWVRWASWGSWRPRMRRHRRRAAKAGSMVWLLECCLFRWTPSPHRAIAATKIRHRSIGVRGGHGRYCLLAAHDALGRHRSVCRLRQSARQLALERASRSPGSVAITAVDACISQERARRGGWKLRGRPCRGYISKPESGIKHLTDDILAADRRQLLASRRVGSRPIFIRNL